MSQLSTHRYTLQPYAGPKSRTSCPACGKPEKFTRYVDTETGELLPVEFGRCDRADKCAYFLSPYTRPASGGRSYAGQVRFDERTGQPTPTRATSVPAPRPLLTAPAPAVLTIPPDVFRATLGHYERNHLARLLRAHFGVGVADELLSRFHVGTSAHWPGACVFWLIDDQGRVRGGQVVLYDETGHTVKQRRPDGSVYRFTRWAHTALAAAHQRRGTPAPVWLSGYQQHGQKSPCLFGLPQLSTAPTAQPVALVESAKTAILCTPYFPRYCWLATGGLGYLTAERLVPLKGRRIVLFPDAGALNKWQAKADELRGLGFDVSVSDELETLAAEDASLAGSDLADVLLNEYAGYPPDWDAPTLFKSV